MNANQFYKVFDSFRFMVWFLELTKDCQETLREEGYIVRGFRGWEDIQEGDIITIKFPSSVELWTINSEKTLLPLKESLDPSLEHG